MGLQKPPFFIHDTLFTCHSFTVNGHNRFGQVGLKSQQVTEVRPKI